LIWIKTDVHAQRRFAPCSWLASAYGEKQTTKEITDEYGVEERQAVRDEHHKSMTERAKERGVTMPGSRGPNAGGGLVHTAASEGSGWGRVRIEGLQGAWDPRAIPRLALQAREWDPVGTKAHARDRGPGVNAPQGRIAPAPARDQRHVNVNYRVRSRLMFKNILVPT